MASIIILSGSPSLHSHTEAALQFIGNMLARRQFEVIYVSVRDFSPTVLSNALFDSDEVKDFARQIQQTAAIVIGTPVYKATYTGVLKSLLDLLPEDGLENKPILPIMTGGSSRHLLAIDYAFHPLLTELKAEPLPGIYILDKQISTTSLPVVQDEVLVQRIRKQVNRLIEEMNSRETGDPIEH